MNDINRQKTLALAAVFQAAAIADSLAWKGIADKEATKTLLESTLVFDTDNPEAIYGNVKALELGLKTLEACLVDASSDNHQADKLRYALGMIHIEGQLNKSSAMLTLLRQRLEQAQRQLPHFDNDIMAQGLINNLAGAYVDTIGTLRFRIQIKGNEQRLKTAGMAEQIRANLLAGVRAAWLWQRLGGRRWHLLFTRGQILTELRLLIKEAQQR
jgi:high frequency lysogenization protein